MVLWRVSKRSVAQQYENVLHNTKKRQRGIVKKIRTWALNNSARLLRLWATSGCSSPNTFFRIASDSLYSGSASSSLPCDDEKYACGLAARQQHDVAQQHENVLHNTKKRQRRITKKVRTWALNNSARLLSNVATLG